MREKKSFEIRLQELKDRYVHSGDFDLITILELEDEYGEIDKNHTKRRSEVLDMRRRLMDRLH